MCSGIPAACMQERRVYVQIYVYKGPCCSRVWPVLVESSMHGNRFFVFKEQVYFTGSCYTPDYGAAQLEGGEPSRRVLDSILQGCGSCMMKLDPTS